jgi:hypothetical protein
VKQVILIIVFLAVCVFPVYEASNKKLLDKNQADIWNSGKTSSEQSFLIPFGGQALVSSAVYGQGERAQVPAELMGHRYLTPNTVIRVNQIEVARDRTERNLFKCTFYSTFCLSDAGKAVIGEFTIGRYADNHHI